MRTNFSRVRESQNLKGPPPKIPTLAKGARAGNLNHSESTNKKVGRRADTLRFFEIRII
jgi:hypothetical protein